MITRVRQRSRIEEAYLWSVGLAGTKWQTGMGVCGVEMASLSRKGYRRQGSVLHYFCFISGFPCRKSKDNDRVDVSVLK